MTKLNKMAQNPKDWVMPTGDYANTRYSKLNQINAQNVGKLQVAWTFSTGVLRGHEGGPLIIGNMMYVHTPFPNKVYAIDLSNENKIVWKYEPKQDPNVIPVMCCDTVNRGLPMATARSSCIRPTQPWSRSTPRAVRLHGPPRMAIPARARPALRRRWSSRTRCWSASPAASSAFKPT